jgi:hypothetical protein
MPGGMGDVRVMTVKEFQALSENEANELIKNSDGVQAVNDDALNTSLNDKKKQLGIPKMHQKEHTQIMNLSYKLSKRQKKNIE